MALSVQELEELLDESKRAYFAGENRFQYRDRSYQFQGASDHWQSIQHGERELARLKGGTPPARSNLASFSRG